MVGNDTVLVQHYTMTIKLLDHQRCTGIQEWILGFVGLLVVRLVAGFLSQGRHKVDLELEREWLLND
jgi:hypothetical protein